MLKDKKYFLLGLDKTTHWILNSKNSWNKFSVGGVLCGIEKIRTPTTVIILKLVTKPNMCGVRHLGNKIGQNGTLMESKTQSDGTKGEERQ